MTALLDTIQSCTAQVLDGQMTLDAALHHLDTWLAERAPHLSTGERDAFSQALDNQTSNDNTSLVDSVLKLHATRLLYRYDVSHHEETSNREATSHRETTQPDPAAPAGESTPATPYEEARTRFARALRRSEEGVNEARIDIAIANAHHLLGDVGGNRRWLDSALNTLPDLANSDLLALARFVPAMPPPQISGWKRFGLKLIGFPFERLAASNSENLIAIARMQMNQLVILAHLLGTSFEAIHERQRARRAFHTAAHLVARYHGLPDMPPDQALDIAEDLQRSETDAARTLARQVIDYCSDLPADDAGVTALRERADALLAH